MELVGAIVVETSRDGGAGVGGCLDSYKRFKFVRYHKGMVLRKVLVEFHVLWTPEIKSEGLRSILGRKNQPMQAFPVMGVLGTLTPKSNWSSRYPPQGQPSGKILAQFPGFCAAGVRSGRF